MKKSTANIKLGKIVKKLRKERRLSQDELAEKIGMSTDTISNIERAVASTTIETLEKIADAFDVKICELFQFHEVTAADKAKAVLLDEIFDILKEQSADILQFALAQIKLLVAVKESFINRLKK